MIVCGIVSQSVAMIVSYPGSSNNNWKLYANNQFQRPTEEFTRPTETFSGPSSYAISYPSTGNYGTMLNVKSQPMTSSYSTYEPAENAEFGSTTYINYPPQSVQSPSNGHMYQHDDHSFLQPSVNMPSMSGQSYPSSNNYLTSQNLHIPLQGSYYPSSAVAETSQPSYIPSSSSEHESTKSGYHPSAFTSHESSQTSYSPSSGSSIQSSSSGYYPSKYGFTAQVSQPQTQYASASNDEPALLSQHFEVTKPVVVPVYKKFPYAVNKMFRVAIPHPVLVPVPHPYPGLFYLFQLKIFQK